VIEMEVSQELSGVSAADFASDPSVGISFTQSVAEAMGISNNSVEIVNVTEVTPSSASASSGRRVSVVAAIARGGLRSSFLSSPLAEPESPDGARRLSEVSLQVDYVVTLVMQSLGFQDSDEAVSHMKQTIQESVSTGEFTEILKAVGALANATATRVTIKKVVLAYSSPSPTLRPTSQPSTPHSATRNEKNPSALSEGGLIGVIVSCGLLSCLFIAIYVSRLFSLSSKQVADIGIMDSHLSFGGVSEAQSSVPLGVDSSQLQRPSSLVVVNDQGHAHL
jgi:hypothetical protein